jgi:integrase
MARLSDSKTGRKSIFLNAGAVAVLNTLPRMANNPFVIVYRAGHLQSVRKVWDQIRTAASIPDVRLYDLRHTNASVGADEGLSLPLIGKLLGHSAPATTQRYAHVGEHPAKRAAEMISTRISAALAGGR